MKIEISKGTEEYYKPLKVETNIFYYKKLQDRAVEPFKARASDSGYDLTILEKVKTVGMVEFYSTGIAVQHVKEGWYFDMVPRSSISKSGYILANSVGVIDNEYTGEVFVPLIKIDEKAKDILADGPVRIVQLIPRQVVHFIPTEVDEFGETSRGDGGFGSSGRK